MCTRTCVCVCVCVVRAYCMSACVCVYASLTNHRPALCVNDATASGGRGGEGRGGGVAHSSLPEG